MNLYAILRRNGWKTPDDLHTAAGRSKKVGDAEMANDVRWIRSYVMQEPDGTLGTVCIYEATSPEAIQKHANRAELACSEIRPIADTVVVRADPAK
ncbi:MAG: nickel-binding protein [Polyangiaceae bacterium]